MKKEVAAALKELNGVHVYYQFPKTGAAFPAVTYYETANAPNDVADDGEYTSIIAIMIDVWADTAAELTDISHRVNIAMYGIGFVRKLAQELSDPSGKCRKTMRFEIIKGVETIVQ